MLLKFFISVNIRLCEVNSSALFIICQQSCKTQEGNTMQWLDEEWRSFLHFRQTSNFQYVAKILSLLPIGF